MFLGRQVTLIALADLYFLGLRWQYRANSSQINGLEEDAEHLSWLVFGRLSAAWQRGAKKRDK